MSSRVARTSSIGRPCRAPDVPVDVARPGHVRAPVAAAHRHDDVGRSIVRRLLEEPWKNIDVVDELVDESPVGYDPSLPEPLRGPKGFRENVSMVGERTNWDTLGMLQQLGAAPPPAQAQ